jgi:hypothetical protein
MQTTNFKTGVASYLTQTSTDKFEWGVAHEFSTGNILGGALSIGYNVLGALTNGAVYGFNWFLGLGPDLISSIGL